MRSQAILYPLAFCFLTQIQCIAQQKVLQKIPEKGASVSDFTPQGYSVVVSKEGDLNMDSLAEMILVLEDKNEAANPGKVKYNRILVILFKKDAGYQMAAKTDKLVICSGCGFEQYPPEENSIEINKGVFTLFQHGGSTQQWLSTRKFRYQNGDFYMIGTKEERYPHYMNLLPCKNMELPGSSMTDINLVTGARIVKETSDDCVTTNKHDKIKVKPLIKLSDVNLNTYGY